MSSNTIKTVRAQRTSVEEKIAAAKLSRRKAADDASKAKYTKEIEALRVEKKRLGATLRKERAKA